MGYPVRQAVGSLNSYRWPRRFVLDRMMSEPVLAVRGIAAGSVYAMYELMMVVTKCMEASLRRIGFVPNVCVHVDDINTCVAGACIDTLVEQVVQVVTAVRAELAASGLEVAAEKTTVLASTLNVAARVAEALGVSPAAACTQTRRLGIDHALSAGVRRNTVWVKRRASFRGKLAKLGGWVTKRRVKGIKVYTAGLLSARLCGAECQPVGRARSDSWRQAWLGALGSWRPGCPSL